MLFKLLIIISSASLAGCLTGNNKCCAFIRSYPISDSVYIEIYQTYCGGVFGDVHSYYATDSSTFRAPIGGVDEHQNMGVAYKNGQIEVYTLQSSRYVDTLERKTIPLSKLLSEKRFDSSCTKAIPVFGKDTFEYRDCSPYASYKNDDDYYIVMDQFKHGRDYVNAKYLTDSVNFRILIGFYDVGAGTELTAKKTGADEITFYRAFSHYVEDTVARKYYKISELSKGKLEEVCKKK